jgi:hypothetical protein
VKPLALVRTLTPLIVVVRKAVPDDFAAAADAAPEAAPELAVLPELPVDVPPQAAVTSATAASPAGTPHLIRIVHLHSKRSAFTLPHAAEAG